ncbi:MAG: alkylhydroperoxidase-related (seleno)protein, partial [Pseudomonadota bacterium]
AAGVAANFQRMVRIADSIGIPIDDMTTELGQSVRDELELTRFHSAQNTLNR